MTHVLVSVGDSIDASTMISMYLKELAVPNVWVKANHDDHAKLLKKVGVVDEVVTPGHMAAEQLPYRIDMPGLIQKLTFDPDMVIWDSVYMVKAITYYILHEPAQMKQALRKACGLGNQKACQDLKHLRRVHQHDFGLSIIE